MLQKTVNKIEAMRSLIFIVLIFKINSLFSQKLDYLDPSDSKTFNLVFATPECRAQYPNDTILILTAKLDAEKVIIPQ